MEAYEEVVATTKAGEREAAVSAELLQELSADATLRREFCRPSVFASLATSTTTQRDNALAGELSYYLTTYRQGASAYLVSNGMSTTKLRGRGVPASLAGLRTHLHLRASAWVENQFGSARAHERRAEVHKLAVSLSTGTFMGESDSKRAEHFIVPLLGGSRPHPRAEIDEEGGSVNAGTLGTLEGEGAQASIRQAYRAWAQGLGRAMGPVLLAVAQVEAPDRTLPAAAVLGELADFNVDAALQMIPQSMPIPAFLSVCRFLTSQIATAALYHRSEPGAPLPQVVLLVERMVSDVFPSRYHDVRYETHAQRAVAALEAKLAARWSSPNPTASTPPSGKPPRVGSRAKAEQTTATTGAAPATPLTPVPPSTAAPSPSSGTSGAQRPPRQSGEQTTGTHLTRLDAIRDLQSQVRARLQLPMMRNNGASEPCAWKALAGVCTGKNCLPCTSVVPMPHDLLQDVQQRCAPGLFASPSPAGSSKP